MSVVTEFKDPKQQGPKPPFNEPQQQQTPRGIGRAVALAFAREGADVVVCYLNEDADARETERLVRDAGRKAITIPVRLSRLNSPPLMCSWLRRMPATSPVRSWI